MAYVGSWLLQVAMLVTQWPNTDARYTTMAKQSKTATATAAPAKGRKGAKATATPAKAAKGKRSKATATPATVVQAQAATPAKYLRVLALLQAQGVVAKPALEFLAGAHAVTLGSPKPGGSIQGAGGMLALGYITPAPVPAGAKGNLAYAITPAGAKVLAQAVKAGYVPPALPSLHAAPQGK